MTEQEQKAFDAAYADALKQSRPGTIRDIARLCYESALTAANAVNELQQAPLGHDGKGCNEVLRMAGKVYPRTCKACGLGPCKWKSAANAVSHPQATEPAPSTYEPIGWADWQGNMVTEFRQWSDGSSDEIVVYRKLAAAPEAKQ